MTEQEREPESGARGLAGMTVTCPTCGARNVEGDRYCAACGALLPSPLAAVAEENAPGLPAQAGFSAAAGADQPREKTESAAWLLAAKPPAVIGGGFLLLLLAAALLAIGQRESTGTIVMLSICLTPLALLTLLIGLARFVAAKARG